MIDSALDPYNPSFQGWDCFYICVSRVGVMEFHRIHFTLPEVIILVVETYDGIKTWSTLVLFIKAGYKYIDM